jgi:predicted transcriptional regulator
MLDDIQEVKRIRHRLGLTQEELAQRAGISQSMIAKIEAGNMEPSYSNATKIFKALDDQTVKEELKAESIMTAKIISISPSQSMEDAVKKMKTHGFSQLPVMKNSLVVGMITESSILDALMKRKEVNVSEIMESPPPIVPASTASSTLVDLLKYYPMVLVSGKNGIIGMITKTDLLVKLREKRK